MAAYVVLGLCVSSVLSLPVSNEDTFLQFPQLEDGGAVLVRHERDGGAHGHGHGGRRGQRQQAQQIQREQDAEEDRGGSFHRFSLETSTLMQPWLELAQQC